MFIKLNLLSIKSYRGLAYCAVKNLMLLIWVTFKCRDVRCAENLKSCKIKTF